MGDELNGCQRKDDTLKEIISNCTYKLPSCELNVSKLRPPPKKNEVSKQNEHTKNQIKQQQKSK